MKGVTDGQMKYLVAMYCLKQKKPGIRSVELSRMLGVTRASVNGMLSSLAEVGLINKERYGHITLTEEGEAIASHLYAGFCAAQDFFSSYLKLEEAQAREAALIFLSTQKSECIQQLKNWMDQPSTSVRSAT